MTTVSIPQSASEVPGPVPGNTMTKEYVQMVGRMAYKNHTRTKPHCRRPPSQGGGRGN